MEGSNRPWVKGQRWTQAASSMGQKNLTQERAEERNKFTGTDYRRKVGGNDRDDAGDVKSEL